ncbi:MAG TPA: protein phosphatase 2C domain-containing protein [Gammaproteobacteria bacterium]
MAHVGVGGGSLGEFAVSAAQWVGGRERQEDAFLAELIGIEESGTIGALFGVADGMGGETAGDLASRLGLEAFVAAFRASSIRDSSERLVAALNSANDAIKRAIEDSPDRVGMGTTMLVCYALAERLYWASVGDSVLLLLRDRRVRRLNADHSYGAMKRMLAPQRSALEEENPDNALLSYVNGSEIELIDAPAEGFELRPGDVVVAATDGLESLCDADVLHCLEGGSSGFARRLVERVRALDVPNQDNVTVVVLGIEEPRRAKDPRAASWYARMLRHPWRRLLSARPALSASCA